MVKHHTKLNQKVEEALAWGRNDWLAQPAELQIFRVDAENRKKEGHEFFKMDKNNIQVLREDLAEEFQALAQKAIGNLLEEVTDDQLLLTIEADRYERKCLQAVKEELASAQASAEVLPEGATQVRKVEDVACPNQEIEPVTKQDIEPK